LPSELFESIRIPKERIGALIGKSGKEKKRLEGLSGVKLEIDSESGEVEVQGHGANAENFYSAVNVVKAIGRGFSPENAMLLIGRDYLLDIIKVSDIVGGSEKALATKRGRVIGRGGKARETIERETNSKISVMGKTIAIIARPDDIEAVRRAVEMLLQGANHSMIYKFLQRRRLEGKKFSI